MKAGLRLLYVVNDPVFFLSHRLPVARAAKARGFDVHVATPFEECVSQIASEGFVFHPIGLSKHGTGLISEFIAFISIYRLFRRLSPVLVHLVTIKPVIYGGLAARLARIPALVSAVTGMGILFVGTSWRNRFLRFISKQGYRIAFGHGNQTVVFQNPDDLDYCVDNALVSDGKVVLIKGSGVDMQKFSPQPLKGEGPIILMAGRMLWEKGVGDFVDAARLIKSRGLSARFVLVGSSVPWNSSSVSDSQLMHWHEEGVIEWWGQRDDMTDVFAQTEIACLPSAYGEGVPKYLIEAAACGKPIVTTDSPGCREIVQHEKNGLLVPVKDVRALAEAIEKLLGNESLRLKMGNAGRKRAVLEFSQEQVARLTLDTYDRLLHNSAK